MADEGLDWSEVEEPMARQILTQAETYLQSQLQCAIAADGRATSMAALFVTLALAALGAGFGYSNETDKLSPLLAGLASGALLTAAASCAAWAARPIDFFFPGNVPSSWTALRHERLATMLGYEAENLEGHIAANDLALGENQAAIRRAYWLAIAAPLAGAAAWLLPLICSSSPVGTA